MQPITFTTAGKPSADNVQAYPFDAPEWGDARPTAYRKTQDFQYEIPSLAPNIPLTCWVEVWEHPSIMPIVLVTQMANVVPSITNQAEDIAKALCRSLWNGSREIVYLEYHPKPQLLQRVTFKGARREPSWQRVTPAFLQVLTGHVIK
jgi:hypothetical protein